MKHFAPQPQIRETACAFIFTSLLAFILIGSFIMAFTSAGPIVLGTEMNTNGMVEYMCLGSGCENLNSFTWVD